VHLQSNSGGGITLIPAQNSVKQEEELRRVLFTNDHHQVRDYNFFFALSRFSFILNLDLYHYFFLRCSHHFFKPRVLVDEKSN
jgi:hypothetical protein